jgi:hypothetical protein
MKPSQKNVALVALKTTENGTGLYEVHRVCPAPQDQSGLAFERCENDKCDAEHLFGIYEQQIGGGIQWLADCESENLSRTIAKLLETTLTLAVGDTVRWTGGFRDFDSADCSEVKVLTIEHTEGGKYGDQVDSVPWAEVKGREYVVSLSNDHWAYAEQIARREV